MVILIGQNTCARLNDFHSKRSNNVEARALEMDITINWFQSNALNQMFQNSFFILMVMSFRKKKKLERIIHKQHGFHRERRSQWVFWNKILIQFSSLLFEDAFDSILQLHKNPNKCCNRPELCVFFFLAIFKCFPLRNLSACRHYSMHKTYVLRKQITEVR